jgi:predicted PurR-regulated permease PerM
VFALDDRTGDVLTTITLFAAIAAIVYVAHATIAVFVLALLLAYLLEPLVGRVERRLPERVSSRTSAIAVVYLAAATLAVGAAYKMGPAIAAQWRRVVGSPPDVLARLADREFLSQHGDALATIVDRAAAAASTAAEATGWLVMVPVVAVFFLQNRAAFLDGIVDLLAPRRDRGGVKRAVERIDTMLAQYVRAQLTIAGLSAVVYAVSMAILAFPYPLALGLFGGALEFVPVVGWIIASAIMLASGWLAHAHWIWMAAVIAGWQTVLNLVLWPRIMGDRLQMEPITVMFALMAGGQVGGLLGAVLSVPAAAIVRIVWLEHKARRNAAAA